MKEAVYPGSFNPFHAGHANVITEALKVFDKIYVLKGINPDKNIITPNFSEGDVKSFDNRVEWLYFEELLADTLAHPRLKNVSCIIKGLRNGADLEYEKSQYYWNQDLGIKIPTFYIIANRDLVHISSSAYRQLEKFKKAKES